MNRKVWKCSWGVRVQELSKLNEPEKKPNSKKKLWGVESKLNRTGTTEAKKKGPDKSGRKEEETELRNDQDFMKTSEKEALEARKAILPTSVYTYRITYLA